MTKTDEKRLPRHATWADEVAAGVEPAWWAVVHGDTLYLVDDTDDIGVPNVAPTILRDSERNKFRRALNDDATHIGWRGHHYRLIDQRRHAPR